MTTNHHTAISAGAAANASTFNTPLGALDAQITTNAAAIAANALLAAATTAEVVAARGSSPDLDARLDALVLAGGNVATKANGVSVAGQKVLTVDATDGFIVGAYVTYLLNGTTLEGNTIGSIQAGVSLTLGTNIGTGGVLDDTYISMISISEYQAAQAIPHAGTLMLPQTMTYANGGVFNVMAYGASPGASSEVNTAAIEAAIVGASALSPKGKVIVPSGVYAINGGFTLATGLHFAGEGSVTFTVESPVTVFTFPGYYALVENITLSGTGTGENAYTGISFEGDTNIVRNVQMIKPLDGIVFPTSCFYNRIQDYHVYLGHRYGVDIALGSNNNVIHFSQISGTDQAGSIGIRCASDVNLFIGGEINGWGHGISDSGQLNTYQAIYEELCVVGAEFSGKAARINCLFDDIVNLTGNADVSTPYNNDGIGLYNDINIPRASTYDLKCLYLFNEGSGQVARDYSGLNNHGIVTGGSWVQGQTGYALQLDAAAGDKLTLPVTTILPTTAWTLAICLRGDIADNSGGVLFEMNETGNDRIQIEWKPNVPFTANITAGNVQAPFWNFGEMQLQDRWGWLFISYDPATKTLTSLSPVAGPIANVYSTDPISAISALTIHKVGTLFKATYQMVALWQRALSYPEVVRFVNQPHAAPTSSLAPRHSIGISAPSFASATSVGSGVIVNQIAIYDEHGTRLGFVPIYDALLGPLAYDGFTRANGALGVTPASTAGGFPVTSRTWVFSTGVWVIATNKAKGTPASTTDVVTNGTMEADANWSSQGTPVTNEQSSTVAHGGTYSRHVVTDAGEEGIRQSLTTEEGAWYALSAYLYGNSKGVYGKIWTGAANNTFYYGSPGTAWAQAFATFQSSDAGGKNLDFLSLDDTGSAFYVDDVTCTKLTLASMIASVQISNVDVSVAAQIATMTAKTQAGLVARLDSAASPATFILVYFDKSTNKVRVYDCIAGTYTAIDSGGYSKSFTANDTLKLVAVSTDVTVKHITAEGVETTLGTGSTSVTTGTLTGLFSTDSGNTFASFAVDSAV